MTTNNKMKNKILLIFVALMSIQCVFAFGNSIPVQIQTTDVSGNIVTGTYEFTINISNSDTCNPVLYSNITNFTTDARGIVSYDIEVPLDFSEQYYLCYYRDGVLKQTKIIGVNPYAFRANVSDNLDPSRDYVVNNMTASYFLGDGSLLTGISTYINGTGLSLIGTTFSLIGTIFSGAWGDLTGVPAGFADGIDNDTGSGLTHLTNFTEDILWTSDFNNTGDGRWILYNGETRNITTTGNITANVFYGDVKIDTINGQTYQYLQDWIDTTQSAGKVSGGIFTSNGDGTVNITTGTGFIKTSNSATANTILFDWDTNVSVPLTDQETNYIYVDYNSGSPIVKSSLSKVNNRDKILLGKIFREGTVLHLYEAGMLIAESTKNVLGRFTSIDGEFTRANGMILSETELRHINKLVDIYNFISLKHMLPVGGEDTDKIMKG